MKKVIIDGNNNTATVHFNTKFYDPDKIMLAARNFAESCWIHVDGDREDTIQVNLTPKSKELDLDVLGYEFYNYVLGTMKNSG